MTEPQLAHHLNDLTERRFQAIASYEATGSLLDAADIDRYTLALQKAYDEWARVTGTKREIVE
jgi:hypothetical protein